MFISYLLVPEPARSARKWGGTHRLTTTIRGARPAFREEVKERFARHLDEEEVRVLRRAVRKVIRASGDEPRCRRVRTTDGGGMLLR